MIQPKNDWDWKNAQTLIGDIKGQNEGFGRSLWKSTTKGEFYWPVAGIQLSDTVYIFCSGVKLTGTGTLGFDYSGQNVLAKMKFPEMKVVGYKTLQDFYSIHYGIGFINDKKTGYTYVYGIKTVPKNNDLYVARFPTKNPNTLWEAWDGKNWNSNMAKAACIKSNVGATPYISKVKNKILMVSSAYSVGCDMGKDISSATSSRFMGPFSDLKTIYTIPDRLNGHSPFFYVPASHPEYINSKNELLVTYCINGYGTCVTGCNDGRMEADRYRVRGICVPLSLIDPALK
ncbi:MAG: hypothetical protein EOP51_23610 [Sphingobacteriales bacterium]|nr:MAG: hypothetical protein EOP51_23610 [Sphingobacteriales bacterium]